MVWSTGWDACSSLSRARMNDDDSDGLRLEVEIEVDGSKSGLFDEDELENCDLWWWIRIWGFRYGVDDGK